MHFTNLVIHHGNLRIARGEADGLLYERDYFLYAPGHQLAVAEREQRPCCVAIERKHRLVFANSLFMRRRARNTSPLAKWTIALRGDLAKACPTSPSARAMSDADVSVISLITQ